MNKREKLISEQEVKVRFKAVGLVYTRQRAALYRCMQRLAVPQTAAQIAAELAQELPARDEAHAPKTWISTVYRNLELFVEKTLASPFKLPEGEAFAYYLNDKRHRHYAVCTACKRMIDLHECPLHEIERELAAQDFTVSSHHIEIYGRCAQCTEKEY